MSIFGYFDLTRRRKPDGQVAGAPAVAAADAAAAPIMLPIAATSQSLTFGRQALIYCTLMVSVLASRYIDLYRIGMANTFVLNWGYLLFTALVALLVFPAVYDKALATRGQPVFMQIALIFSTGMGWEKIVATVSGH